MKATRSNQRIAHEIAKTRTYADVDYRALREENARRVARATGKLAKLEDRADVEFMRSIMSTPYAVTYS